MRVRHHRGTQRIEFDVAMALQEMRVIGDQAGLVATFPQGAGAMVGPVYMTHVTPAECLHHAADATDVGRRHEQVDVVGHQHVRMDCAAFAQRDFIEVVQIAPIVAGREEAGLAIVAALDDVLRDAGEIESWWARHADVPDRMPESSRVRARSAMATR